MAGRIQGTRYTKCFNSLLIEMWTFKVLLLEGMRNPAAGDELIWQSASLASTKIWVQSPALHNLARWYKTRLLTLKRRNKRIRNSRICKILSLKVGRAGA